MSLIRRGIGYNKTRVRAVLITSTIFLITTLVLILGMSRSDSFAQPNTDKQKNISSRNVKNNKNAKAGDSKKTADKPKKAQPKINAAQPTLQPPEPIVINAKAGVYNGPGAVPAHNSFEQWLGKQVPYATDYIDYKGGWQKDFVDYKIWLIKPWSDWVKAGSGRRLVLGMPMLENANYGQFNEGVNGAFDLYYKQVANDLISSGLGNSVIRLGYEANCDTIGPWQATNNPEGYRQLFRHIVGVMRSVPASGFSFDWTVCNGLQGGKALNSFDSFYPGNDVVDIIGMDIYDVKWQDPGASRQLRWQYLSSRKMGINEFTQFARAHGKPVSYPEWGLYRPGDNFAGGGDNPYFINKMAELMSSTKPIYQSYFNLNWGGGVLSDFPQGKATFKQVFSK
jgi:hypothetical protein